ncbi:MAG: endonuclease/exonuclease/phosphatase family protein [Chloroflexi bacterium]|nr:endonuclease/exonuclease/phosphatase family protein [Chloroflexota bacterium]
MDAVVSSLSHVWTIVVSVYLIVLVLLFVAGRVAPDSGLRGLATSLMYRLFFLAALLLIPGLWFGRWLLALALLLPIVSLAWYYAPRFVRRARATRRVRGALRVATFNIEKAETNPAAIVRIIRQMNADIVAIQELSQTAADCFLTTLNDLYPHKALHPQPDPYIGQGVLSRFPILAEEYWYHPELAYSLGHMRVELDLNGTRVALYNSHPATPVSWVKGFTTHAHRFEIAEVLNRAGGESCPVIIAGDFNMTTHFEEYQAIAARYTDAYLAVGDVGFGFTYPGRGWYPLPPFLRLDYIFYDSSFRGLRARVWPTCGPSDHYPVLAELLLYPPPNRRTRKRRFRLATLRR